MGSVSSQKNAPSAIYRPDPDRKQRIINAALNVIVEHGVQGTTAPPRGQGGGRAAWLDDIPFQWHGQPVHLAFTQVAHASSAAFLGRLA
nr:hypothetical protein [Acetobacter malorum]